jgi:hypothetical protein
MAMRSLVLPFALLFCTSALHAQDVKTPYRGNPPYDIGKAIGSQPAPQQNAKQAVQQPNTLPLAGAYLFPYWTKGILRPYTGRPQRAWLKYNSLDQQLIARTSTGTMEQVSRVDTDTLREFTIGDSAQGLRVTYRRYLNARTPKPSLRTAFFEVHYDAGKSALLCRRLASPTRPDILHYFFKTSTNELLPLKLGRQPVLAALGPAHASTLAAYVLEQQLNLEREADVVRLLAYFDTL